jgi:predicted nucleic acid-binding protein
MIVADALQGVASVLLDTAPVIYHLEQNPAFAPVLEEFFKIRAKQGIRIVTTPITLAECLIHPIRQNRRDLVGTYQSIILGGENTTFWPIGAEEGTSAAHLRANHGLTLSDALQVAIAIRSGCQAILTNDSDLAKKVTELRVLVVSDLQQ